MKGYLMSVRDLKSMDKVMEYRKRGLGVREIGRLMKKDPTQILRWMKYSVDTYPQKKKEKVLTASK